MKYFRLMDALDFPNRWFLGPFQLDTPFSIWDFITTGPLTNTYAGLSTEIQSGSIVLDFTFAEFGIPVLNDRAASFIPIAERQLIELKVGKFPNFNVLILLHELDCLDESKSDFTKFDENYRRPELAGQYQAIYSVVLDKRKCSGHSIFRIKGYRPYIIVNEEIRGAFIANHIKGVLFQEIEVV
jgi:hypothetical protein